MRLQWFEELLPHVDAADVELAAPILAPAAAAAKQQGKTLIISRHCFENGEDKEAIADAAEKAFAAGADIFKFAGQVESEKDFQTLRDFLREWKGEKDKALIVIGMGDSSPARRARLELPQRGLPPNLRRRRLPQRPRPTPPKNRRRRAGAIILVASVGYRRLLCLTRLTRSP